jgi:dTDP-4-amino-4,6-dideoxygalactose transaminase
VEIDAVAAAARERGIRLVEDCSQAHGARCAGRRVGRFGDVAVFSAMFSKGHAAGGCGGLVYTEDEDLYWRARSSADRGKAFRDPGFDPKDPRGSLFPALNFNLDELSCAIGLSTLGRLDDTIRRRAEIAGVMDAGLAGSRVVSPCRAPEGSEPSLFYHTLRVDAGALTVPKEEFARAVAAEGVGVNPHTRQLVGEWPWLRPHLAGAAETPNAAAFRDGSFNILFNERYSDEDAKDVARCILKAEEGLAREGA